MGETAGLPIRVDDTAGLPVGVLGARTRAERAGRGVDLVVNIPKNASEEELTNDYTIRRAAVDHGVPLITKIQLAQRLAAGGAFAAEDS